MNTIEQAIYNQGIEYCGGGFNLDAFISVKNKKTKNFIKTPKGSVFTKIREVFIKNGFYMNSLNQRVDYLGVGTMPAGRELMGITFATVNPRVIPCPVSPQFFPDNTSGRSQGSTRKINVRYGTYGTSKEVNLQNLTEAVQSMQVDLNRLIASDIYEYNVVLTLPYYFGFNGEAATPIYRIPSFNSSMFQDGRTMYKMVVPVVGTGIVSFVVETKRRIRL